MLLNGLATPKIAPSSWDFVTMLEQERATAIGNMHRKIGKDHVCGSRDMLADRQTDPQTQRQMCSLQDFATAPAGRWQSKHVKSTAKCTNKHNKITHNMSLLC